LSDQTILKDFSLGLHAPGTFDRVINIDECLLQSERANLILRTVADYCIGNKLQPYGIKSHQGFLRFLVIRQSQYNNGIMVNIVTAFENPDLLKGLTALLVKQFPEIKSIMNNINPKPAQIAMGEKEILLYGTPAIAEKLSNLSFSISANSFFQTNTKQAELMYKEVLEFADLKKHEVVWDLYSGTGTFALFLAKNAKFVTGFELIKSAVENAWQNAKENQIHNVRFVEGDILFQIQHFDEKPDVIITDPPRSGMHEKIVKVILGIAPARIIYVSCNPATLARDLSVLIEKYYIEKIQPIDMFPQTYHIETIVKLVRKE
jgi:23S rRNA (uracil1939-C5)-methyltransferase